MALNAIIPQLWAALPRFLSLVAIYSIVHILVVVAYRLTFHPLAKYPGPFLAKITDWYQAYYGYLGIKPYTIARLHKQYGDYVRYGPNLLLINNKDALRTIYAKEANVEKSPFYIAYRTHPDAVSIFSAIDKNVHGNRRRILSHGFSENALRGMNPFIVKNINIFSKEMPSPDNPKEWGPSRNIAHLVGHLTFNVMSDLVFGHEQPGVLETEEGALVLEALSTAQWTINISAVIPRFKTWHLDRILFRNQTKTRDAFDNYSKVVSTARIKREEQMDRKDLFHYIIESVDPESGKPLTPHERLAESTLLIVAGSDTTSIAITSTFFQLTRNPDALAKLENEILSTFKSLDDIYYDYTLLNCRYLRACVDEAMRLSPSVAGHIPRRVLPGGIEIQGNYIPAGLDVGVGVYTLHHDERYFHDPKRYWPERWIAGSEGVSEEDVEVASSVFHPFSIGPRACIGKRLAYNELLTTIARVLWTYEIRREPGSTRGATPDGTELNLLDIFTEIIDGPMVQFRLRRH